MTRRAPYFHVYIGLMVVFASYAMGVTMRVREARLRGNAPHGCTRRATPPAPVVSAEWKPVVEKYAGGVCLLVGTFTYVDVAGNPFHYDVAAYKQRGELVSDPNGPVFANEFKVTAFHVGNGVVLTYGGLFSIEARFTSMKESRNNSIGQGHVSNPEQEFLGHISDIRAYFPNQPKPFHLKPDGFRLVHNVPELTFELNGADVPALKVSDYDASMISVIGHNDQVGRKLLLLWQPVVQETDASPRIMPTIAETSIGWNRGCSFLMNSFRDGQIPPPGTPILDEQGVVIGMIGSQTESFGFVESEFDTRGIMPRMPIIMGETYGAHLYHQKSGFACNRELEQVSPAKKSRRHR
jgi:hypothetical protein